MGGQNLGLVKMIFQRSIVISVVQRSAKLQAVKLGDLKKILPYGWIQTSLGSLGDPVPSVSSFDPDLNSSSQEPRVWRVWSGVQENRFGF